MQQLTVGVRSPEAWSSLPIGDTWAAQFKSFNNSAFRLEVLQAYGEPSEKSALELFKSGNPVPKEYIADWCKLVRDHTSTGRTMSRVHIVHTPLSEYLRFEIECAYSHTKKAGENILLLDSRKIDESLAKVVKEDFWLFDDQRVMVQDYSNSGKLSSARLTSDPTTVNYYKSVREKVLALAEPFDVFYFRETGRSV